MAKLLQYQSGKVSNLNISSLAENTAPSAGDWLVLESSAGNLGKIDVSMFPIGSIISPSQITSNQNNYNPTGFSGADIVRISTNALRLITGFAATTHSRQKQIVNIGTENIIVTAQDASSSAANRIDARRDIVIAPGSSINIWYDTVSSRWRLAGQDDDSISFNKNIESVFTPVDVVGGFSSNQYATDSGSGGTTLVLAASSTIPVSQRVSTGTTSSGVGNVYHRYNFSNSNFPIFFRCRIITPSALSNGTDTYTLIVGMIHGNFGVSATPNGAYLKYSHSVNGGVWQCVLRGSGIESTLTSGVTMAVTTVTEITICMRPDSTVAYWINGSFVGEITTNYPSNAPMRPCAAIIKSAGSTESFLGVTGINARETR